jgi:DNA-binding IclR family transcriptional regulator
LREHVRSVWGVELLLLLRADPDRCWTPAELVRELRASTALVNDNLQRFVTSGLVVPDDGGYRYAPASPVLEELCAQLESAYRERPVAVINMIARPDPLQSLADAFKFRGGK